jgi:hypothetical protein
MSWEDVREGEKASIWISVGAMLMLGLMIYIGYAYLIPISDKFDDTLRNYQSQNIDFRYKLDKAASENWKLNSQIKIWKEAYSNCNADQRYWFNAYKESQASCITQIQPYYQAMLQARNETSICLDQKSALEKELNETKEDLELCQREGSGPAQVITQTTIVYKDKEKAKPPCDKKYGR